MAKTVLVSLRKGRRTLQLTVEDDGKGFQKKKRSKGLGLHIMDYRASVLGGTFEIESKPMSGTRITCIVPLKSGSMKKQSIR
jgi:signal transduction histidine kinase